MSLHLKQRTHTHEKEVNLDPHAECGPSGRSASQQVTDVN